LADRINDGPLPVKECLRIAYGVLSGVARIHTAGFVHLNIKPSNILFSDSNAPMVADFGQSRQLAFNGTVTVPPMYKLAIPPETFQHRVALRE